MTRLLTLRTLLAIQLNNQLLLNVLRNAFPLGVGNEGSSELGFGPVQPVELGVLAADLTGQAGIAAGGFFQADDVTGTELKGRYIDHFAVHGDMLVGYQLTGSGTG